MTDSQRMAAGLTSHIVIPARLASTRLPQLLLETGKTLIQHTYEAQRAKRPSSIWVATDHERSTGSSIVWWTRGNDWSERPEWHGSRGRSNRRLLTDADIVSTSGDEPDLAGESIAAFNSWKSIRRPLCRRLPRDSQPPSADPACVKVVFDNHRAQYLPT